MDAVLVECVQERLLDGLDEVRIQQHETGLVDA